MALIPITVILSFTTLFIILECFGLFQRFPFEILRDHLHYDVLGGARVMMADESGDEGGKGSEASVKIRGRRAKSQATKRAADSPWFIKQQNT